MNNIPTKYFTIHKVAAQTIEHKKLIKTIQNKQFKM